MKGITFLSLALRLSPPSLPLLTLAQINHQYDKSSQFLSMATRYVQSFLSPDIVVSSPLDTLWEIEVHSFFFFSP